MINTIKTIYLVHPHFIVTTITYILALKLLEESYQDNDTAKHQIQREINQLYATYDVTDNEEELTARIKNFIRS